MSRSLASRILPTWESDNNRGRVEEFVGCGVRLVRFAFWFPYRMRLFEPGENPLPPRGEGAIIPQLLARRDDQFRLSRPERWLSGR
jgi:hypothetical protein